MNIQSIADLPDVAERSAWVKMIGLHGSTFRRAELAGKLRASKPGGRIAIYKKSDILRWLQLDDQKPVNDEKPKAAQRATGSKKPMPC